jgi:transposase
MDQVHVIRHKVLVEGLSARQVAREMRVSRNTVRRYLEIAAPTRVEVQPRARPVWETVGDRLHELLQESPRWTGGKQRLTATRLHQLLRGEGFEVGVTMVKQTVAEWKRERREVFVPLVYRPGELAQVDFFEVLVDIDSKRRKAWMFLMRLMHSGRDFAWLYDRQDQIGFLDGHVRAFEHFGAVPQRIAYDNLKPAVTRVLVGAERVLSARFQALASHYLFEPSFCRPATGHDKGGVESRGRAIRWQHLVPIPEGGDMDAIRHTLLARLDGALSIEQRQRFDAEQGQMLPLPQFPFQARRTHTVGASRRALITVEGSTYSVPCTWAGLDITAHVGPDDVVIAGPTHSIVRRRGRFGERVINYGDYIRELARKPQAVRQVAAELVRDLGEPFGKAWRCLVEQHGPGEAARIFAKVLGYVDTRGLPQVAQDVERALQSETPLLLAVAPKAATHSLIDDDLAPIGLRTADVASGRAVDYDRWLMGGVA